MNSPITLILLSVLAVSLISLIGVTILALSASFLKKILLILVSFAVGALFANVFLHMLPEMIEGSDDIHATLSIVLAGIIISFVIEKFIHWHHCHNPDCHHATPVGTMMLIGDGVHNLADGMLIATSYLMSTELGIATTIAVVLHEIPQEIGDFAVLIHSGFTRWKALLWNFASACTAFIGAIIVIILHNYVSGIEMILLPLAAGNFLYIAGSDLVPELHKESKIQNVFFQLLAMVFGILLMASLSMEHSHNHEEGHDEHAMVDTVEL